MAADDVTVIWARDGADHRTAFARGGSTPMQGEMVLGVRIRMRGQPDMVGAIVSESLQMSLQMKTARRLRRAWQTAGGRIELNACPAGII